jgi:NO-binding membrane sensor protein with MHYT domain
MSGSRDSVIGSWLRSCFLLLLLLLGDSLASGFIYSLWSRFIGWPVVNSEREVFLRFVHLLPSLACAVLVGCVGGAINRIAKTLWPAVFLAVGIALLHYASYSRASRAVVEDIVAAAIESLILFVVTFISFWIVTDRRRRRRVQAVQ